MARKRVTKKNSQRKRNSTSRKVPNPFKRFSNVTSTVKSIPWNEKTLLVALLLLMGIVAVSSEGGINNITGSFTEITGEATIIPDTGIGKAINDVFGVFYGFISPIYNLLGAGDIVTVKLLLSIILYMILVYSPLDLGSKMKGKGKVIAGLGAAFAAAVLPQGIIDTYILSFIPAALSLFIALGIVFVFLWILHKYKAKSSPGHLFKALSYFLIFIYTNTERADIVKLDIFLGSSTTGFFTSIPKIADFALLAALVYAFVRMLIEVFDAVANRDRRNIDIEGGLERTGRGLGTLTGAVAGAHNQRRGEKNKDLREEIAKAEEFANKEAKN